MVDARECSKCRKGFCKSCIDDYLTQMIDGEYEITCPNCSTTSFKIVEPHPLVQNQLSKLVVRCENHGRGCTEHLRYTDVAAHKLVCGYALVKCTHFGCEKEMLQKDYAEHQKICEFREITCDKCGSVVKHGEECNCIAKMAARYEKMEAKLAHLAGRLSLEMDRAEKNRLAEDRGTQLVRCNHILP